MARAPRPVGLDKVGLADPVWADVTDKARTLIDEARAVIEGRRVDHVDTEFHRGRIAAARAILALGEAKPAKAPSADPDAVAPPRSGY